MKNGLRAIFPLSSGRYLGVSTDPTIKDGNASYVFYKLSLGSNKRFKIEDGLDWGLEAQPFRNGLFALPALERDLLVVHSARIGKWLLIMSPETGIIWIFDSDKAELSRVVEVFSSVDEARLRKNDLMQCITGAQPRSDGDLLISSHSEDYVLKGKMLGPWKENSDLWFKEGAPQEDVDANVRRYFENAGAALRAFPEVLWWRLDPGTGHLAPEQPPLNVPDRIDSTRLLSDFNWRFRPDGSLRFQSEKALQLESQTFLSQSGWTDTQTESSSKAGGHQK